MTQEISFIIQRTYDGREWEDINLQPFPNVNEAVRQAEMFAVAFPECGYRVQKAVTQRSTEWVGE